MFKVTICDFGKMNINMTDKIEKKEATLAVPYNGEDNNDYVDGKGFCCNEGSAGTCYGTSSKEQLPRRRYIREDAVLLPPRPFG